MDENKNIPEEEKEKEQAEAAENEYDPESYYEKDDVYDFVEDDSAPAGSNRRKNNTGAAVAAVIIAAVLIGTGVAAKTLLGKIGDAKLKKDDGGDVKKIAVTELDDSSAADEESDDDNDDDEDDTSSDTRTSSDGLPDTVLPDSQAESRYVAHASDLSDLKNELNEMIKYYPGDWSVYVQEVSTGADISIGGDPMPASDMIDLFAMTACYQKIKEGHINEDYAYDYIYRMVTQSDSSAFDTVVELMGEDYLAEWLMQNGYWDTTLARKQGDSSSADSKSYNDAAASEDMTSAKDVGKLLSGICRGDVVDMHYSKEEMVKILKDQTDTDKIPAGLPEGVEYGNKTSETSNICYDGAIVFSGGAEYVLVVMAKDPGEAWVCKPFAVDISRTVYDYFNTLVGEDDSGNGISADEYYDDEYEFDDEELEDPPYEDNDIIYDDEE